MGWPLISRRRHERALSHVTAKWQSEQARADWLCEARDTDRQTDEQFKAAYDALVAVNAALNVFRDEGYQLPGDGELPGVPATPRAFVDWLHEHPEYRDLAPKPTIGQDIYTLGPEPDEGELDCRQLVGRVTVREVGGGRATFEIVAPDGAPMYSMPLDSVALNRLRLHD